MTMTKKKQIIKALEDFPNLTNSQIAKRIGCHPSYVNLIENEQLARRVSTRTQTEMFEEVEQVSVPTTDTIDAVHVPGLYTDLAAVLEAAYNQAAYGKGAERHADSNPWIEQPIFSIARQVGDGFNAGQVIKKVQEAQQMAARGEYTKAQHEVLGAIVYAASLHVLWGKGVVR